MSGPTVNWTKLDTGAWRSEIVEGGRYQLASPSTVTGNPSLTMQAGQSCTVRVYIGGALYPDASLTVNGTTPVAILNAIGQPLTGQEKFDLVIEVAMPYGQNLTATDEPNGSPSSPFTSEAQRTAWATANLASLLPGRSTVWGPGDSTEYRFVGPGPEDFSALTSADPYPVATGSLSAILASVSAAGTVAAPNDVYGGRLQSDGVSWVGFIGCLTVAQAAVLDVTNVGVGSWYHLISADNTTTPIYVNR